MNVNGFEYCENELSKLMPYTNNLEEAVEIIDMAGDCGDRDFEYNGFRFIHETDIDDTMADELSNDEYVLGCFNSGFLASLCNIDQEVFECLQKSEALEACGKLILNVIDMQDLVSAYVNVDGYGNHFSHYDHSEDYITINGANYYVFNREGNMIDEWSLEGNSEPESEQLLQGTYNATIKSVDIFRNKVIVSLDIKQDNNTVKDPTTGELLDSNTLLPIDRVVDFTKVKFSDLF